MIDIKFRAWLHDGYDDDDNETYSMTEDIAFEEYEPLNDLLKSTEFPLMQFTGLTDKNGVEIYDKSILKYVRQYDFGDGHDGEPIDEPRTRTIIGKVGITPLRGLVLNGFVKTISDVDNRIMEDGKYYGQPSCISEYSEVIGNIYEHPELLNQKP